MRSHAGTHACALSRTLQAVIALLGLFVVACVASPGSTAATVARSAGGTLAEAAERSMRSTLDDTRRTDSTDEDAELPEDDEYGSYTGYDEVDEIGYGLDELDAVDMSTGGGDIAGLDGAPGDGWPLGHGCHSCRCLPPCRSSRCNIRRPCRTKRCTGHCKWPKRSKRGRPIGACRLGNCSRLNPGEIFGAAAADRTHDGDE